MISETSTLRSPGKRCQAWLFSHSSSLLVIVSDAAQGVRVDSHYDYKHLRIPEETEDVGIFREQNESWWCLTARLSGNEPELVAIAIPSPGGKP
jgi:hypothetical protein